MVLLNMENPKTALGAAITRTQNMEEEVALERKPKT